MLFRFQIDRYILYSWLALILCLCRCSTDRQVRQRFVDKEKKGRFVLGLASGHTIEFFDIFTGGSETLRHLPLRVYGAQFSDNGSMLAETDQGIALLSYEGLADNWFSNCVRPERERLKVHGSTISSDGNMVALVASVLNNDEVLLLSKGCLNPQPIVRGNHIKFPSISRDGSRLAFQEDGEIYLVDTKTLAKTAVLLGTAPALSHDAQKLAYVAQSTLQILELKTSKSSVSIPLSGDVAGPVQWSPEDSMVAATAFARGRFWSSCDAPKDLSIIDASDGEHVVVATLCNGFPTSMITWLPKS